MAYTPPPLSEPVILTRSGYTPPPLSETVILGEASASVPVALAAALAPPAVPLTLAAQAEVGIPAVVIATLSPPAQGLSVSARVAQVAPVGISATLPTPTPTLSVSAQAAPVVQAVAAATLPPAQTTLTLTATVSAQAHTELGLHATLAPPALPLALAATAAPVAPARLAVTLTPPPLPALALTAAGRAVIFVPVPADRLEGGTPRRLLSDPLPLRRSIVLPTYRVDQILPWVYGRVTLSPVPLDAEGLAYLVADHPIVGVSSVTVGGLSTDGWQLSQSVDARGNPVSQIRLAQAPKAGQAVACTVLGRRHPVSGALLEHPADIAEDLLAASGWAVPDGAFDAVRDAWPGVTLGGVIDSATTLRAAVSTVLASVGADWCAAPLLAWDSWTIPASLAILSPVTVDEASAESTHADLVTRVRVTHGYDWALKGARASLVVEAPDAVAELGGIEADLDLPWVRTARDALAIAAAWLRWRARPRWDLSIGLPSGVTWRPGQALDLQHPWVPQGPALIRRVTRGTERDTLLLSRPAGEAPRVEMTARGSRLDAAGDETLSVVYRDGVATFTILNESGDPLAGASVTLDEAVTHVTDRAGQVQFTTARGAHTLLVVANGYQPFEMQVTV